MHVLEFYKVFVQVPFATNTVKLDIKDIIEGNQPYIFLISSKSCCTTYEFYRLACVDIKLLDLMKNYLGKHYAIFNLFVPNAPFLTP